MPAPLRFRDVTLDFSRAYIVGVLNVTPDSFSDGGRFQGVDAAVAHARRLVSDGADILDIGGESTRPVGAERIDADAEIERTVPVIEALAQIGVPLSIDTTKAEVARAAVRAGAELVNDISGGGFDPAIVEVCVETESVFICGHARGRDIEEVHASELSPPGYMEVAYELTAAVASLPNALRHRVIVDPGLGFGKKTAQNLELSRRAGELAAATGCTVMVGPSRKRFLGELTGLPVGQRDSATVGACLAAVVGGAHFLRVHDVRGLAPALRVFEAVMAAELARASS